MRIVRNESKRKSIEEEIKILQELKIKIIKEQQELTEPKK
jgi:hypothetical protein